LGFFLVYYPFRFRFWFSRLLSCSDSTPRTAPLEQQRAVVFDQCARLCVQQRQLVYQSPGNCQMSRIRLGFDNWDFMSVK
jgi:hypothetical protein